MSDHRSEILSSMERGSAKRRQNEATAIESKATAVSQNRTAIEAEIEQLLAELPAKSFEAAEADEVSVAARKIENDELVHGYEGYNALEHGRDSSDVLRGAAAIAFDKLQALGLQPEILHGGEIDFPKYGEAYYITIPVVEGVVH